MRMKPSLEFSDAQAVAEACRAAAEREGAHVAIAVVDEAGALLHLQRLAGAKPHAVDLATRKARTAAALGLSTALLERMAAEGRLPPTDILALGGGLPILREGECAGAIGVSGATSEVDGRLPRRACSLCRRAKAARLASMPVVLELPPIRSDLDAAKADLDCLGLARLAGVLNADELAAARERLVEQAAGEEAAGVAFHDSGDAEAGYRSGPNQRVWNLINKGEIFRRVVLHPTVRALIGHMLGEEVLLSSFTGNIANPGGVAQGLHRDDGYAPRDLGMPIVANSLYMLDDFTEENGATRVAPGSHLDASYTSAEPPPTVAATGPAGTVMVFDGRLWHGTGANRSMARRAAMLAYYCRPFVRQQENMTMSLAPEVVAQCSPELLSLLGFQTWRTLGMVEGSFHGVINPRPTQFVTELTP